MYIDIKRHILGNMFVHWHKHQTEHEHENVQYIRNLSSYANGHKHEYKQTSNN